MTSVRLQLGAIRQARNDPFRGDARSFARHTGGGNPPGGSDLERRVQEIEKVIPDIRERLARVETKLDSIDSKISGVAETGATKESVKSETMALRADMAAMETRLTRWMVATALTMTGVSTAIAFGLARLTA